MQRVILMPVERTVAFVHENKIYAVKSVGGAIKLEEGTSTFGQHGGISSIFS